MPWKEKGEGLGGRRPNKGRESEAIDHARMGLAQLLFILSLRK